MTEMVSLMILEAGTSTANLFPNPANTQVSLAHTERLSGDIVVTLFDVHGREKQTTRFEEGQVFSLEVAQLPQGVYFLSLIHSGQVISRGKILITR